MISLVPQLDPELGGEGQAVGTSQQCLWSGVLGSNGAKRLPNISPELRLKNGEEESVVQ